MCVSPEGIHNRLLERAEAIIDSEGIIDCARRPLSLGVCIP